MSNYCIKDNIGWSCTRPKGHEGDCTPSGRDPSLDNELRESELTAMNIVFQIGDALYEALPKDIAHKYFVDARQKTNDVAIDFATKLIQKARGEAEIDARIDELSRFGSIDSDRALYDRLAELEKTKGKSDGEK